MTDELRQQVRDELRARGMTMADLGVRAGVSPQYVWDVLSGKSSQLPATWGKLLAALDLEVTVRHLPQRRVTLPDMTDSSARKSILVANDSTVNLRAP